MKRVYGIEIGGGVCADDIAAMTEQEKIDLVENTKTMERYIRLMRGSITSTMTVSTQRTCIGLCWIIKKQRKL